LNEEEGAFSCHNDPQQQAIWKAVGRAVRYAQQRGVTVVAGSGNDNFDLTHLPGDLTNACNRIPVELTGVIGVSGNGNLMQKFFRTNYGVGAIDVVAPSGDGRFQITEAAPNGKVLSTTMNGAYGWGGGTSMAVPHVAGVAALIISQYGKMPPGRVQAIINQTADFVPCPENPFNPGPPFDWPAECQGGHGYNSFYGHGQVNAFNAVTHNPQGGPYTKLVAFPMSAHGAEAGELLPVSFGVFNGGDSPELVDYQITDTSGWLPTPIVGQVDLDPSAGDEIVFEIQVPIEGGSSVVTLDASTAVPGSPQDQVTSEILLPEPSSIASLGVGALFLAMLARRRSRQM
jgi:subtilisin family serine protease